MYKRKKIKPTILAINQSNEGETIEKKIRRITNNKEPISDGAPLIFTERKDGVQPQYDIRTDRFELAVDAMDRVTKENLAKRMERMTPKAENSGGNSGESSGTADTATAA